MSDRHDELNREASELRGLRFTAGLVNRQDPITGKVTEESKYQAAAFACLNRRDRRRLGIRGRTPR